METWTPYGRVLSHFGQTAGVEDNSRYNLGTYAVGIVGGICTTFFKFVQIDGVVVIQGEGPSPRLSARAAGSERWR